MIKKTVIKLCSHDDCTGCFACEAICPVQAISKDIDVEGFYHPFINQDKCILCHSCQRVCPVLNPLEKNDVGKVYASWAKDWNIRSTSSSGGLFSIFAEYILENGGVVVGAAYDNDYEVVQTVISKKQDLEKLRGSKYVQSMMTRNLYLTILKALKSKTPVLFCGTPCQVAGIKNYFKRNNDNLYTIDIVCHGVPSPLLFSNLIKELRKKYPNLTQYNFRDFVNWGVCVNVNVNVNVNGKIINVPLYGKYTYYQDAFLKGFMHRPNCYHCVYATQKRIADITLADFWGIGREKKINPEAYKGCSVLELNTAKGTKLFEAIKNAICYEPRDLEETIAGGNLQFIKPSERPKERDSFYNDAYRMPIDRLIKKYHLKTIQRPNLFKTIIKKVIREIKSI